MMKKSITAALILLFSAFSAYGAGDLPFPLKYVNPMIGTGGHGHTYPGPCVPFGMVQLSPDTRLTGWDGCSAYHYSDSVVYGFSHTHLSGTGCSDYGDILLLPMTNPKIGQPGLTSQRGYDLFSHQGEKAEPGYYSVSLRSGINVELTTTERVGIHKYTYPEKTANRFLLLELEHRDRLLESEIKVLDSVTVAGFRRSTAWARNQVVYFYIRFSAPIKGSMVEVDTSGAAKGMRDFSRYLRAYLQFRNSGSLTVKVALSAVSIDGARKNMEAEAPGWDFGAARESTAVKWSEYLKRIEVKGTEEDMTNFYSALYHVALAPNLFGDVDGRYRGRDLKVHDAKGYDYYTVFSLWDTYRAFHPLMTIIDGKRTNDFINTFIAQYQQGGKLPVWELSSNETECMIGYHSVSVIADAMVKGIRGYDKEKAYEAAKHSAINFRYRGLGILDSLGFLPVDGEWESVSKTLEYAYDDWCIAQMAKILDKPDDYRYFLERGQYYKNIFDPVYGFMRPRINGGFYTPFDPFEVNNNYTEANSWQYSFSVPQDVTGLTNLFGSRKSLENKLDALFSASSQTTGRDQSDISGLIGQYAHGNEPSHHIAYLYSYAGAPWKTQEIVSKIMKELYKPNPDGLCGNEDCGQMSAWYVLSALGFYPVCPGSVQYTIGSPLFETAVVNLENGKKFTIICNNKTANNIYIKSAKLNGKDYNLGYITHDEIVNGDTLIFEMSDVPNKDWASSESSLPVTSITEHLITPAPWLRESPRVFKDSVLVEYACTDPNTRIYCTQDGTTPNGSSALYRKPFTVHNTVTLKAYAEAPGREPSKVITAVMKKVDRNWSVNVLSKMNNQYTAGGPMGLIDGINGNERWRLGGWQGYLGTDFTAIIDLKKDTAISRIRSRFLQDAPSWIWMPCEVIFYVSSDGADYREVKRITTDVPTDEKEVVIREYTAELNKVRGRYVKVTATKLGAIPSWHPGAGQPAFIFTDEIEVE